MPRSWTESCETDRRVCPPRADRRPRESSSLPAPPQSGTPPSAGSCRRPVPPRQKAVSPHPAGAPLPRSPSGAASRDPVRRTRHPRNRAPAPRRTNHPAASQRQRQTTAQPPRPKTAASPDLSASAWRSPSPWPARLRAGRSTASQVSPADASAAEILGPRPGTGACAPAVDRPAPPGNTDPSAESPDVPGEPPATRRPLLSR